MEKIKLLLKGNKYIYKLYRWCFNFVINFMKIFIKVKDDIILFNCFGGQKFDDSTKAIYEYMIKNKKYDKYKFYWSFDKPEKYELARGEKIKNNSINYFIIALKAKYWITNSGIERGLKFKNKKTIYINTWHGSTIKKLGKDQQNNLCQFETTKPDIIYAQSQYDINVLSAALGIEKEKFALVGLPRNDILTQKLTVQQENDIKEKLKIPKNKKVIIYMPTFREYDRDKAGTYIIPPMNIDKWEKKLKDEYVLLFRAHYETAKVLGIKNNEFIYNVSNYEPLSDLLQISNILISDYSSVMFDYSILERPIYSFAYDYQTYIEKRGIYIDIAQELPNGICRTEDEILDKIVNCNYNKEKIKTTKFKEKYMQKYGNATQYIDKIIK